MGTHKFKIDGKDFEVEVGTRLGSRVDVKVNGANYAVEIESGSATPTPAPVAAAAPTPVPAAAPQPAAGGGGGEVRAPISGVVLSIEVSAGQVVEPTSKILLLEAMKMENEIFAAMNGTVAQIHVQPQQEVREGDLLATITPS